MTNVHIHVHKPNTNLYLKFGNSRQMLRCNPHDLLQYSFKKHKRISFLFMSRTTVKKKLLNVGKN